MNWTEKEDAELTILFEKGLKHQAIAEKLGTTVPSIRCRCIKIGLKALDVKEWTTKEELKLKELMRTKLEIKRIAAMLGRTKSSINNKIKRLGIGRKIRRHKDETVNAVVKLYRAGEPYKVISKATGYSLDSLSKIIARLDSTRKSRAKAARKKALTAKRALITFETEAS